MKRNGFSMIELVFVVVILGVLAAVAVPRFVATRMDAHVATLRSDASSVMKAIVAKVFADNIDTTASKAPAPNDPTKSTMITWSEWMIEVGGLDRQRWMKAIASDRTITPVYQWVVNGQRVPMPCGDLIQITTSGDLYFNPNSLPDKNTQGPHEAICSLLKESYGKDANKIIPLTSTRTLEF
ncbi:type II secretion system protein [Helicobacter sp. MIT 14-3879]|uniref:type II secretion system protein n=1 Tax=Helicobacter sp. MIT 14-3879 TaxID=2040649 RepID=UPI000E1EFD8C|nr:type II secretion system protein [Helicobacter sp. MIT 14-3879]RDU65129.1 hypothetical protein CQA44_02110 [Helicobacter sp. MIT 14-3879]